MLSLTGGRAHAGGTAADVGRDGGGGHQMWTFPPPLPSSFLYAV